MDNTTEIRTRIFDAADKIFEESGHELVPTVDAVRKRARVNTNDASTFMKDWRRKQAAKQATDVVHVPAALQSASNVALVDLWSAAVSLASESLRAAQIGWEAERAESEILSQQTANAVDEQSAELDRANSKLSDLQSELSSLAAESESLGLRLDSTRRDLETANSKVERAKARSAQVEQRAGDLRLELDYAHQLARTESDRSAAWQQRSDREIEMLRSELRTAKDNADLECARMQALLNSAAETAANLAGKVEALTITVPKTVNKNGRRTVPLDGSDTNKPRAPRKPS